MSVERECIANWCFGIQGTEFICDFYNDDSCDFYSFTDRNAQVESDRDIFIKATIGDPDARLRLENHAREFTITVNEIDPALILDIMDLEDKIEKEGDITPEDEREIEERLAPYFWEHVNPYLTQPLTR